MVDIIVVNYNTKHLMDKVIDSIFKWTPSGAFRLFVVDNGSTDGSYEFLQQKSKFLDFTLIGSNFNAGVGPAYNNVISRTVKDGNDVVLVHSDIEIRSPWLEEMQSLLKDNKGMVEVKVYAGNDVPHFGGTCFTLLSRHMLTEVGLFSKEFFQAEDEDFRVRVHAQGWRTAFCKTANIFHLQGGTLRQQLSNSDKLIDEATSIFKNKYTQQYLDKHHCVTVEARNKEPLT